MRKMCYNCSGGWVIKNCSCNSGYTTEVQHKSVMCPNCSGTGTVGNDRCHRCGGSGRIQETEYVKVPHGVCGASGSLKEKCYVCGGTG